MNAIPEIFIKEPRGKPHLLNDAVVSLKTRETILQEFASFPLLFLRRGQEVVLKMVFKPPMGAD